MRNLRSILGLRLLAFCAVATATMSGLQDSAPAQEPGLTTDSTAFRRLSESEYERSIASIFGPDIKVPGRFEPALRVQGLLALGASKAAVTPAGFEQAAARSWGIAEQVMAPDRRARILPCAQGDLKQFDRACARSFLAKYGRLLYRRPLEKQENDALLHLMKSVTNTSGSFSAGLVAGLSRLLLSPQFIYRIETSETDPHQANRVDSYSLASRISFLVWAAPPDDALLDAAASGAFQNPAQLSLQLDRMMASPRFEEGMRVFFSDMLGYERFQNLGKDQSLYPVFSSRIAEDAKEQTLRTITDLLISREGDYRDLFTTRKTFMNRRLGALYGVPVAAGAFNGWVPYTFSGDEQRAGILTLAAFLMLDPSHEGRSSPTVRGKSAREQLLCETVPPPPANVNFSLLQDTNNPALKTARQRLDMHRASPVCAACHAMTDPIGLALENYDTVGSFRTLENGAQIDPSGTFDGKKYANSIDLTEILRASPKIPACFVRRLVEYGTGRETPKSGIPVLKDMSVQFANVGYRLRPLIKLIVLNPYFAALDGGMRDMPTAKLEQGRRN